MELSQYPIHHIVETYDIQSWSENRGVVGENQWGQPVYGDVEKRWHGYSRIPRREEATGATFQEMVLAIAKKITT